LGLLAIEEFLHFLDVFSSNWNTHSASTCLSSHIWLPSKKLLRV